MFQTEWEVLIVDDEPDVLAVSKLAMKNTKIYGAPLKLHLCQSKSEAIELIQTKADLLPALAVALVDVVMETDTAGLDLCRFIREERKNNLTQLFIRTGQPGVAPEREVIDRYDINGYFTKAESTEDKLYSMVKSGVRQYYWSAFAIGVLGIAANVTLATGSREAIARVLQQSLDASFQERTGEAVSTYGNVKCAFLIDDCVAGKWGWEEQEVLMARDRLEQMEGVPLGPSGSKYVIDDENRLLVMAKLPEGTRAYSISAPAFRVPEFVPALIGQGLIAHAAAWRNSAR